MQTNTSGRLIVRCGLLTLFLLVLSSNPAHAETSSESEAGVAPASARLSALLINGGGRRQSNYYSHLDHLRKLVSMLQASGIDADSITVLSSDGADPAADLAVREGYVPVDFWLLPRREAARLRPPIEYINSEIDGFTLRPATNAALEAWFEAEGEALAPGDTLLLYVTDHGDEDPKKQGDSRISLWGEELSVTALGELLSRIDPGVRIVMLMSQCYSGGFANAIYPDGAESVPSGNVCGYFSAPPDRKAHGCYPEISGRDAIGHSYRLFEALAAYPGLADAHLEVLVTDGTPDVPNASSEFFLARELERQAANEDKAPSDFIDSLLLEAWQTPLAWEREIRLLDRIGFAFGFSSPRSLEQLALQSEGLEALRDQLDTYAERWSHALEALRTENLAAFHSAYPAVEQRVQASALNSLSDDERAAEISAYLEALDTYTNGNAERTVRLLDLYWKAEQAKSARYRADVRIAAVLRMQALLTRIAGRHFVDTRASGKARTAYEALTACEDLAIPGAAATMAGPVKSPEPFPTLEQERSVIEAVMPAWLGLHYRAPQLDGAESAGLPRGAAEVSAVLPGSPAETAGLQVTDIVLGPPGAAFRERHEMREWVMQSEIGVPLSLAVLRDGEPMNVSLTLAPFPVQLPKLPGPPQVGSAAPAMDLDYVSESKSAGPGRARVLFFWATWCNPCKASLPEVLAFARERDVEIVSITDEEPGVVNAFLGEFEQPFPEIIASDKRRVQFQRYGVSGTPTFVLVDGDGIVQHVQAGYRKSTGLKIDGWRWTGRAE